MKNPKLNVLHRYIYDPLDRLSQHVPLAKESATQFIYQDKQLKTLINGHDTENFFHSGSQLLAQHTHNAALQTAVLVGTDKQHTVLHYIGLLCQSPTVYSPYGHSTVPTERSIRLSFNGEYRDPLTENYLLGNGYRAYNPRLMRFNTPDSLSPFGKGGINAYAYCEGDPVNYSDPSGHGKWRKLFGSLLPKQKSKKQILKSQIVEEKNYGDITHTKIINRTRKAKDTATPIFNPSTSKHNGIDLYELKALEQRSSHSVLEEDAWRENVTIPTRLAKYINNDPMKAQQILKSPNPANIIKKSLPKTATEMRSKT
ncbi:MAG TPA: hypothetical protein DIT33_22190 [Pseudomonas sp.]|uniref:RHS repeat-associated core domain-containing protein n=1 Tax=Pseudomonas sp. TaxID=306 RepID=UPI000EDAECF0|nr:RHS repeat-associated core domain-containing protein [Pseudomonas sp.]HCN66090.1 hypothetical protein [Pseudomonas sp.]